MHAIWSQALRCSKVGHGGTPEFSVAQRRRAELSHCQESTRMSTPSRVIVRIPSVLHTAPCRDTGCTARSTSLLRDLGEQVIRHGPGISQEHLRVLLMPSQKKDE